VAKSFPEAGKAVIDNMVSYMKKEFLEKIRSTSWFDNSVQSVALQKVEGMGVLIAYPTEVGFLSHP
jgi:predicted metalloendopeptidase